jgi:hypothetical protein
MNKIATAVIGAILLGGGASALRPVPQPPTPQPRLVRVEVRDGPRIVASPAITLAVGTPAAVTVGGPDGFAMTLRLDRAGTSDLFRASFYRPEDGGWKLVAAPAMTVLPGRPARLSAAADDGYGFSAADDGYGFSATLG